MAELRAELLAAEPREALAALLDLDAPTGPGIPPLWHWVYLLNRARSSDLGPDGHPVAGIPAPPGPGVARMFAGGRVRTHRPLTVGAYASRESAVRSVADKTGRSGPLTFVTVAHTISQDGEVAIEEEQDIVYRQPNPSAADRQPNHGARPTNPAAPSAQPAAELTLDVDERLLFRFSALTYNAHRIHYDLEFCRAEGYAGLVVHGPLQALLLGEAMRRAGVSLLGREFSYRLVAPMTGPQRVTIAAGPGGIENEAEAYAANGQLCATARLTGVPNSESGKQ